MEWKESIGIEKKIILRLKKGKMSISDVSKSIKKPIQTVSPIIKNMEKQGIINKEKEYSKDSRESLVSLIRNKIKVKILHRFYLNFLILATLLLFFNFFLFVKTSKIEYLYSSVISIIPLSAYMIYFSFIQKDKIIVEKKV